MAERDLFYTTVQGDTFDMIALDYYNDEHLAMTVAQANPDYAGVIVFDARDSAADSGDRAGGGFLAAAWKRG